jgi:hypothetical protein
MKELKQTNEISGTLKIIEIPASTTQLMSIPPQCNP